jgi:hypothetical protein
MVDGRVILLADVAILRLDDFAEVGIVGDFVLLKIFRRKNIRRGENFFAAQLADAGLVQLGLVALDFLRLAPAHGCLDEPATFVHIGTINGPRRREQPCPLLLRKLTSSARSATAFSRISAAAFSCWTEPELCDGLDINLAAQNSSAATGGRMKSKADFLTSRFKGATLAVTFMATKSIIKPAKSPVAVGPYNHAVRVGDLLFCAGQIPIRPG